MLATYKNQAPEIWDTIKRILEIYARRMMSILSVPGPLKNCEIALETKSRPLSEFALRSFEESLCLTLETKGFHIIDHYSGLGRGEWSMMYRIKDNGLNRRFNIMIRKTGKKEITISAFPVKC